MEQGSDWATFDALMGVDAVDESGADIGPLAFYGRCSTEDNQDPETSRAWQLGNARKFVEPLDGHMPRSSSMSDSRGRCRGSAGRRHPRCCANSDTRRAVGLASWLEQEPAVGLATSSR